MKDLVPILPTFIEKIGNMSVKEIAVRDAEHSGYAHYMATMLRISEAQREENKKLAEIRFRRHGIDPNAQQPSTQAILARPKEKDLEHFLRPLVDCQIKNPDGSINVGERPTTREEVAHVEATRRRPKNTLGQSEKSGSGEERKGAAKSAYLCSPPTTLSAEDQQRLKQLIPYEDSLPLAIQQIEEKRPKSVASRLFHWIWKRGLPLDRLTKKEMKVD